MQKKNWAFSPRRKEIEKMKGFKKWLYSYKAADIAKVTGSTIRTVIRWRKGSKPEMGTIKSILRASKGTLTIDDILNHK